MADLISRQAAIKLLRGECVGKYPSSFCFGLFAAADELSKLPAVDAIVLPCKVRDQVWLNEWRILGEWQKLSSPIERHVIYFSIEPDGIYAHLHGGCINVKYFGEVIFLTREEAEAALKKRREENAAD